MSVSTATVLSTASDRAFDASNRGQLCITTTYPWNRPCATPATQQKTHRYNSGLSVPSSNHAETTQPFCARNITNHNLHCPVAPLKRIFTQDKNLVKGEPVVALCGPTVTPNSKWWLGSSGHQPPTTSISCNLRGRKKVRLLHKQANAVAPKGSTRVGGTFNKRLGL